MLTSKALSKKTTATYCTAQNAIFVHKANVQRKNVHANNAQRIIRNVSTAQLAAFKQLPPTYLQNAKARAFPALHTLQTIYAKLFA